MVVLGFTVYRGIEIRVWGLGFAVELRDWAGYGFPKWRGPQYRTPNTRVIIFVTPRMVALIFGKLYTIYNPMLPYISPYNPVLHVDF